MTEEEQLREQLADALRRLGAEYTRNNQLVSQVDTLEKQLDAALLHPSDPRSSWRGLQAECKAWELRALGAEAALKTALEILDSLTSNQPMTVEQVEWCRKVRR